MTSILLGASTFISSENILKQNHKEASKKFTQEVKQTMDKFFLSYEKSIDVISKNEYFNNLQSNEDLSKEDATNIKNTLKDYHDTYNDVLNISVKRYWLKK